MACAVADGCCKQNAAGGDSMFFDAIEHERSRQQSVSLLRDRAFRLRETTAEQQVQALQAELLELRAILEADRQAAQATVSLLASERAAHAEALRSVAAETQVKQAGITRSKMARLEAELREEAHRQSNEAQQRQQLERQKAERAKREAAERHAHEVEGLSQRVRDLQAALVARDGEVEARMISLLERLDASEKALVTANSARSAAVLRAETAGALAEARARETREAEEGLTAAQAELAQARAAATAATAASAEAAEAGAVVNARLADSNQHAAALEAQLEQTQARLETVESPALAPSPHPAKRAPRSRRGSIATPAPSVPSSTAMSMTAAAPASEPPPAPAAIPVRARVSTRRKGTRKGDALVAPPSTPASAEEAPSGVSVEDEFAQIAAAAATHAEAGLGPARRTRRATRHTPDASSTVSPVPVSADKEQRRVGSRSAHGSESPVGGKRKRRSTRRTGDS